MNRPNPARRNAALVLWMSVLISACATYGPQSLPPGASIGSVTQSLGPPTADMALPAGGRRLEYARGPYGKHTYLLDFDDAGRLLRWEQVLTEANFNAIRAGMTSDEVLMRIGHASETGYVGWQKQIVWSYRYESPFCQWFRIGIDTQGRVVDTLYGPDPQCDDNDSFPFSRR